MLSLFCMTWPSWVSSDDATVPTGKHLTLIMMLVLRPAHQPFMNNKYFKLDSHFIFNMFSKCLEIPQHDKILSEWELLLLQFWAIKCVESPLSDYDNHGISEENAEALYNDGLVPIHITSSIYMGKKRAKSYEIRHILKALFFTTWYLILPSHLKHKKVFDRVDRKSVV